MNVLEINEIGKFIRNKRKEQGLRLEDLADEHISTATISNVERGVPHVNKDKVLYLLDKLNINIKEIPKLMIENSENTERVELTFTAMEALIDLGKDEEALLMLKSIPKRSIANYQAIQHLLQGKRFLQKQQWKKAERELSEAIRYAEQDSYAQENNVIASSYAELARCSFERQDVDQALIYVERGVRAFQKRGNHEDQLIYQLQLQQVTYLEQLGHTNEAIKYLELLWNSIDSIRKDGFVLEMYRLRAELYLRMKLHHDAIVYAREGIRLANGSRYQDHLFHLWVLLGKIYLEVEQLEHAETCFHFVRGMVEYVRQPFDIVQAYLPMIQLALKQDNIHLADTIADESLKMIGQNTGDEWALRSLYLKAQIEKQKKAWNQAVVHLERVISATQENGFTELCFEACFALADCYMELHDDEKFLQVTKKMYSLQKESNLHTAETFQQLGKQM